MPSAFTDQETPSGMGVIKMQCKVGTGKERGLRELDEMRRRIDAGRGYLEGRDGEKKNDSKRDRRRKEERLFKE